MPRLASILNTDLSWSKSCPIVPYFLPRPTFDFIEAQDHRKLGFAGTSGGHPSNLPTQAGSFFHISPKKQHTEWANHIPHQLVTLLLMQPRAQFVFSAAKVHSCPACHPPLPFHPLQSPHFWHGWVKQHLSTLYRDHQLGAVQSSATYHRVCVCTPNQQVTGNQPATITSVHAKGKTHVSTEMAAELSQDFYA